MPNVAAIAGLMVFMAGVYFGVDDGNSYEPAPPSSEMVGRFRMVEYLYLLVVYLSGGRVNCGGFVMVCAPLSS